MRNRRTACYPVMLLAPAITVLAVVVLIPTVQAVILSLKQYSFIHDQEATFAGLANYARMIHDSEFWAALQRSLVYTLGTVAGSIGLGLVAAVLMNNAFPMRGAFRTLLLLPWVLPAAVTALIWGWLYDYQFGLINYTLGVLFPGRPLPMWLGSPYTALPALIVTSIWKETPFAAVMLLAALQTIPKDLYEAASIDGAGYLQSFRSITLPSTLPVLSVVTLLELIWAFKQFPLIYIMTGGGPAGSTETLVISTYKQAFVSFDMGYAASLGVVTLMVSMAFTLAYFALIQRMER